MLQDQKEICLIHANCLGAPLTRLLEASPAFASRYRIYLAVNYSHDTIPEDLIHHCSLFLYQHLGFKWEELASQRLLSLLPASARNIRLPVPVFAGYWPFWTDSYPMQFADAYLERLAGQGLSAAEMLLLYLKRGALDHYDLDLPVQASLDRMRAGEAEGALPMADFVEARWKHTQLFNTINHPALPLLHHIADRLLESLGLPPLDASARRLDVSCDDGGPTRFELPIHPQVGKRHGLAFAGPERIYLTYGTTMTFERYVACYISCRLLGLTNLAAYLQDIGKEEAGRDPAQSLSAGI